MKNIIIIFLALTTFCSCSVRYMNFTKAAKKLVAKKITRSQYDSIMSPYYVFSKDTLTDYSNLNYSASYLLRDSSDFPSSTSSFKTMKFLKNGEVIESYRVNDSISNKILKRTMGVKNRYRVNGDELIIEYLLARDYKLYNIFKYAKIRDGSLVFYKTKTHQFKFEKNRPEKKLVYLFDKSLTGTPLLPTDEDKNPSGHSN